MLLAKDPQLLVLLAMIFGALMLATIITTVINCKTKDASLFLTNLNSRLRAWWVMVTIFAAAILAGGGSSIILFAAISVLALREFITITPTQKSDHHSLAWAFFVMLPINYILLAVHWYGLFVIFIPVYAFLCLPICSAICGDSKNFLARTAEIQWGLMLCVYFISYAPAILSLSINGYETHAARLLCFLVFIVEISDVLQYVFGKSFGRHKIVPTISPNKTVEGFVGGILTATVVGTCMWSFTPFSPWQAALMSLLISLIGFGGGVVMSAIKRDRGIKDYSALIPGHGGMLDRIDSLCFAAPLFFHLTRYFFAH
ncbi:MAG: phosphatidate cytidylyltransferase [Candidatus Obscuribacterales bacterium]|nr:phosphatidate cytidylyltransferase [Candidatus Obscuribacterales bacterium]